MPGEPHRVLAMLDYEMSLNESLNPNLIQMWRVTIANLLAALPPVAPDRPDEGLRAALRFIADHADEWSGSRAAQEARAAIERSAE